MKNQTINFFPRQAHWKCLCFKHLLSMDRLYFNNAIIYKTLSHVNTFAIFLKILFHKKNLSSHFNIKLKFYDFVDLKVQICYIICKLFLFYGLTKERLWTLEKLRKNGKRYGKRKEDIKLLILVKNQILYFG